MEKLFDQLMKLCEEDGKCRFYFKDNRTSFNTPVRIFSYHYASFDDWLKDSALECRGIMFELNEKCQPIRIMSRPMEKFFNYGENLFTLNLNLSEIDYVTVKADGSLISTYIDNGELFLKSKTSLTSPQAVDAIEILKSENNGKLLKRVKELATAGYTLNLEYVAPENRIVIEYKQKSLILLNIRNNESGKYFRYDEILNDEILQPYLVERIVSDQFDNQWMDKVRNEKYIEGFVCNTKNGLKFKLKTQWYILLHNGKDAIARNDHLFKLIVDEKIDDLKSIFEMHSNEYKTIEKLHKDYLENSLELIENLYDRHKDKSRKEFAIQTQIDLKNVGKSYLFGVLMVTYVDRFDSMKLINKLNQIFVKNHENIASKLAS